MKYSLRSLFVVVTLVCVVLAVGLAWVKREQDRTRRRAEAGHALSKRGVSFGIMGDAVPYSASQTWRGDESWHYMNYCAFGPFGPSDNDDTRTTVAESDLAILSAEFPDLQELTFVQCQIERGGLKHVALLARLKKVILDDSNVDDAELRFLKKTLPHATVVSTP